MNKLKNDRGEEVVAIGAPGSPSRARVQYPDTIKKIVKMVDLKDDGSFDFPTNEVEQLFEKLKTPEEDRQGIVESAMQELRAMKHTEMRAIALPKPQAMALINSLMKHHNIEQARMTGIGPKRMAEFIMWEDAKDHPKE